VRVTDINTTKHHYPNMKEFAQYYAYGNHNYKTPEKLNGKGPFSNDVMIQKQKIKERME